MVSGNIHSSNFVTVDFYIKCQKSLGLLLILAFGVFFFKSTPFKINVLESVECLAVSYTIIKLALN